MATLRKTIHDAAIAATALVTRLVPDRVPATFVGADSSRELCDAVARSGAKRVLVVTDRTLVEIGVVGRLVEALEAAGMSVSIFDGITPDPTFAAVEAGYAKLVSERAEAVLAVGGGSPIDAAKVIAAMATNGGRIEKLEGRFRVRRPPLALYAIPTTAGTGSEVTLAAVISDSASHAKKFFIDPKLLPLAVALDPLLMLGLPPAMTAATGMDALTHAVEAFLAKTATPQTDAHAVASVRLVFGNLPRAVADGRDVAARKAMALASWYGGLAFTRTSVGYVHAIAHTLGARYGTPHGRANALVLPHVLEFSLDASQERLARLATEIGIEAPSERERALGFIEAVRELEAKIGLAPTLEALRPADLPAIAKQALAEAYANYPVPRFMEASDCEAMLRKMCP